MKKALSFWLFIFPLFTSLYAQSDLSNQLFQRGVNLYNQGKYAEAIPIFEQTQMLDESELPESSSRRNYSKLWIASCYCQLGDTAKAREAEPYAYMAPPVDRRLTIESDQLNELGQYFLAAGNYEEAINYFKQCAEIEHKVLGNHNFYANSLGMIANCMINLEKYTEAKSLLRTSSSIYEKSKNLYGYYQNLDMLSWCHCALNELDSACVNYDEIWQGYTALHDTLYAASARLSLIQCMQERGDNLDKSMIAPLDSIISIFAQAPEIGVHSLNYANALFEKAVILYSCGEPEAENIFKKTKEIWEENGVYNNYDYDRVLYYILGCSFFLHNNEDSYKMAAELRTKFEQDGLTLTKEYLDIIHIGVLSGRAKGLITLEKAIEEERLIMRIAHENIGTDNEYYVRSLQFIAYSLFLNNDKRQAMQLGVEALDIVEHTNEQLMPQTVALVFSLMAYLYADLMDAEKASSMFNRAYQVYQEYNLPYNEDYLLLLSQITGFFYHINKWDESIAAGEQLLSLFNIYKWPYTWYSIYTLLSLQTVYLIVGNTQRAHELLSEVEQAFQSNPSLREDNSIYSFFLTTKSNIKLLDGDVDSALSVANEFKRLADLEDVTDSDFKNQCRYSAYSIISQCYQAKGDIKSALKCLQELQDINYITDENEQHESYSYIISELINSIGKIAGGKYDEASKQIRNAMMQFKQLKHMGDYNQMYLNLLTTLIICSWQSGDRSTLMDAIVEQNTFLRGFVRSHFQTMTYQERFDFWDKHENWFNTQLPNATIQMPNDTLLREAYDAMLLSKGLMLNSEIEVKLLIDENKDKEVQQLYAQLAQNKLLLSNSNGINRQQKDSLIEAIRREEKDLMYLLSDKLGDYTRRLDVTWDQVCHQLNDDDVAIEFMRSPISPDSIYYSALVLRSNYDSPHLVPLFVETQLQEIIGEDFYTSEAASRLIWESLENELLGASRVFFSPIGLLYSLGIEYLPFHDGKISDKFSLYRVSSTREITFQQKKSIHETATLYGGIDYDADASSLVESNQSMNIATSKGYRPRGATDRMAIRDITPLPETLTEIEQINTTLTDNNIEVSLFKEKQGTEDCLKAQSGLHPTYLHIATHGFFWDEEQSRDYSDLAFLQQALLWSAMDGHTNLVQEDRMLTRTGLLFAGANNTLQGIETPSNIDDGILTAQEISLLDFRGTNLVVLSACETGMGEITGEGVFGLQRGFKKAGVQSLLMSLWSVDDTATRLLMTEFYKNMVERKMSKHESLKQAQSYLSNYDNGRYADPRYWAAFILLDGLD